ncbi:MAG: FadR family transcriptional regulator [Desulfuromonadales bacterium]|nr:FadR family transcriptional regulator [Desulfuromonadales bacterium]MBN2792827.1 FadR family transcriptional regulator [Desulfuromonadales bacterium]
MKSVFEEVKVEKVSDKISEQIIRLIVEGKLKPGDKLPGERQLIELLGVGRSSLREALNRLETLGYIEVHKRRGNFVKSIASTFQLDPLRNLIKTDLTKIIQLYDIRRDLEQANAYNAASYRSSEDITAIQNSLNDFCGRSGACNFSWAADRAFHIAVAQATQNFLRVHVITNIFEFSEEFLQPAIEKTALHGSNRAIIYDQHMAIFQAIVDRDAEGARHAMDEHLKWTNERLVTELAGEKSANLKG